MSVNSDNVSSHRRTRQFTRFGQRERREGLHVPQWGCIADDVTGATDLATNLVSRGLRTVVLLQPFSDSGVLLGPGRLPTDVDDIDAIVVALKSRTAPIDIAVAQSVAALEYLESVGAERIYVKYCSTFDSTPAGNIGPVIDAVLARTGENRTIVAPSFPDAARTVYRGHLFVGDELLDESPMRHHPLTPMLDSSLPRLLAPQTTGRVELITLPTVRAGRAELARSLEAPRSDGPVSLVVDAIENEDLEAIMAASGALRVVTGGSGLALGIPERAASDARRIRVVEGRRAVLCGSASQRTRDQVAFARARLPWRKLDVAGLARNVEDAAAEIAAWAAACWDEDRTAIPLVYSADSLADVDHDTPGAAELVERAFGAVARHLVALGATRLIVAGGESSGRVMAELGVTQLRIGPAIAAGVAWSEATTAAGDPLNVALKSGNFGAVDMFTEAWHELERGMSE
ncbi:3-oxo-tetronate kinase [Pseudonocardia xinjiangensis]|uniref:3-oxo-tetronate kinase n=1 Tax=Pseudonocardia xinjiangensis TaxID=75289 RepID=UPI001FE94CEE|nr:3-oxo-tetronate kinase [Pseudonocardia xinjiangensis]